MYRHFEFVVLIDTEESQCTHNSLSHKGMCSRSRSVFKCCEISDNILQTVQHRDTVAIKD